MTSPWPNGARVAVMLTFDFDAESGWLSRDPSHKDRPGVISQGRYGPNVGVPRLLDLLRVEQVPATFFIPGWVAEQHTEKARMIKDAGYEIGHDGYLHERAQPEDRSEEHTSELQSRLHLVCRLLLEKKKKCECANTVQMSRR